MYGNVPRTRKPPTPEELRAFVAGMARRPIKGDRIADRTIGRNDGDEAEMLRLLVRMSRDLTGGAPEGLVEQREVTSAT